MKEEFELLERALEAAEKAGATSCEVFLEGASEFTVKVFREQVENFVASRTRGVGVRAFKGERVGRSYTSGTSWDDVEEAVKTAVENAAVSPEDPDCGLPPADLAPEGAEAGAYLGEKLEIFSPRLSSAPHDKKIGIALAMEVRAREYDPRVSGVESSWYTEGITEALLANSQGFKAGYRTTECYGYLTVLAEERGETQTGFYFTAGKDIDDLDPRGAAREAARRAVGMLGAKQVESQRVPVVFDNLAAAELVGVLGVALSGDLVSKGRSFLVGRVGRKVGADTVTMVDDGLKKGGYGTAPFDAEGVAASRKEIVARGELKGYLHNSVTAARMKATSTGNAARGSYRGRIGVAPTNLYLEPGKLSPEEMLVEVGEGFYVTELQGVHVGLNPITGEISVGVRGWWIEGGEFSYPVREVTIAGDLLNLFSQVILIGTDLRFIPLLGGIGAPTMAVEGLVLGGG